MVSTRKERTLVVIELNGGNDALNTVVPFNNSLYYDHRPGIGIVPQDLLTIDGEHGFNPNMPAVKDLWDAGQLAIINGIGYPQPNRSHFRSRDIWYTAEPDSIGTEGWLGAAIRDLDSKGENVLTGVNFGRGLPRALVGKGVPVASVGNLETYGLLPDIDDDNVRHHALDALGRMYGPAGGRDMVAQALSENGSQALMGADILRTAPERYSSSVEYADTPISQGLRNATQVMNAGLGTRILYAQHGSFDTHSDELRSHGKLWQDASSAIACFTEDLQEQGLWEDTLSWYGPSSAGASATTAPVATMAPVAWPSSSAARSRADSSASTRPCGRRTCPRATWPTRPTSAPPMPPSSTAGWVWTRTPSSTASSSSSTSWPARAQPREMQCRRRFLGGGIFVSGTRHRALTQCPSVAEKFADFIRAADPHPRTVPRPRGGSGPVRGG